MDIMAEASSTSKHSNLPDLLIEDGMDRHDNKQDSAKELEGADMYKFLERSQSEATLLQKKHPNEKEELTGQAGKTEKEATNISECSKVYFDLSKGETFEEHSGSNTIFAYSKSTSGRFLETIRQNEELRVNDLTLNYRGQRSISMGSTSSIDSADGKILKGDSEQTDAHQGGEGMNLQASLEQFSKILKKKIKCLSSVEGENEQIEALNDINVLIEQAWAMPAIGRDLAYGLSAIVHQEKALDYVLQNCVSKSKQLVLASARVLEQVLTTQNREYVADNGLEPIFYMCQNYKGDKEVSEMITGILESLFKTSEEACMKLINLGGLDVILHWCRSQERLTLRHCAIALANLALYGGPECHALMIQHKVPEWLFPLAFNKDDVVRYYACLAISVLVADRHDKCVESAVVDSGTLELVLPFVSSHSPMEFARMDLWHRHGRSRDWLRRLVPVLSCKREEPQALAAFHFAMEAGIKSEQGRKEVFQEIEAVEPLKAVASQSSSATASKLAAQALHIIGEEVPHKLSQRVPLWSVEDVVFWVSAIGFGSYVEKFRHCQVDGDLLLRITDDDLIDSIKIEPTLGRKRFMRELKELKARSDYSSCDPTKVDHWLKEMAQDMGQYTYQLLLSGVDAHFLPQLSEENLKDDCGVTNGVHRSKILQKIREQSIYRGKSLASQDLIDAPDTYNDEKKIDAFISYRRINGAQLASLLKVHLQLRGFSVFLDIERLNAGKFDEGLLTSIAQSKNFILVLTADSLERCKGDSQKKDWVHREIAAALETKCNIIPLTDNFEWPSPESLPDDIKQICSFNGIKWIHDYQDACVDKLERFLRGEKKEFHLPVVDAHEHICTHGVNT